ncbi:hypothetical protein [Roseivivax sp. CAU 1761]
MTLNPRLKTLAVCKTIGLLVGLIAPLTPSPANVTNALLVWGIVLWGVILGATIGLALLAQPVPILKSLPAGALGGWIGLWMGVMLLLLCGSALEALWELSVPSPFAGISVWYVLPEAALAGAFIEVAGQRTAPATRTER